MLSAKRVEDHAPENLTTLPPPAGTIVCERILARKFRLRGRKPKRALLFVYRFLNINFVRDKPGATRLNTTTSPICSPDRIMPILTHQASTWKIFEVLRRERLLGRLVD